MPASSMRPSVKRSNLLWGIRRRARVATNISESKRAHDGALQALVLAVVGSPLDVETMMIAIALLVMLILSACETPLRLDPHRQDLQRQQEQCLARGGTPQECRP